MTFTIKPDTLYLIITLVLMAIQVLQWVIMSKLKKEIEGLWQQISIIAISAGATLEKMQKKIDEKQDK